MADSHAFEAACEALERAGGMERLAARGTIRLALKQAGLDAQSVTADQMRVAAARVLPGELRARGVADPAAIERAIVTALAGVRAGAADGAPDSPEAIFARLGGRG
jgi:hypothetical protein